MEGGVVGPVGGGGFVLGVVGGLVDPPVPRDPPDSLIWTVPLAVRFVCVIQWPVWRSRNCQDTRIVMV